MRIKCGRMLGTWKHGPLANSSRLPSLRDAPSCRVPGVHTPDGRYGFGVHRGACHPAARSADPLAMPRNDALLPRITQLRIPIRAPPLRRYVEHGPERYQVGRAARILAGIG